MRTARYYLVTAIFMAILGGIGLATAADYSPATLNTIFFLAFFPSVAAGVIASTQRGKRVR